MLELKEIVKDYVSGNNVTHALKGISVNFRDNEFVSILGASGCGKTTTLNIIGGLDRYTSGDLIINGKSTKDYNDRDWDTYRNHSIGFIFQSYNLISHQNILKNVELALTIAGISKEERKQRAYKALEIVGLKGLEKKKPNQLSGGQCQRVAIARALINNPEILLADEPTGALDSTTSIQIMELLKEVAKDRLVIMVTHNPDLAKNYSTRIITMSDGVLLDDTNPFNNEVENKTEKNEKIKKSSMSLFTAAGLSISNLFSKLRRTILVTIAGSIGIIGVSAVLAVSQGVKDYIGSMQNDMLSSYPIGISEESVDYTSLMTGLSTSRAVKAIEFDPRTEVGVDSMINYLMTAYSGLTSVRTNTINRELVNYIDNIPNDAISIITKDYGIDPTNNIFGLWKDDQSGNNYNISFNGLSQRYIAELNTVEGFSSYASYVNLFTDFMSELPDNTQYILDQYDVIAGKQFSLENNSFGEDELIFVVDDNTTLTDLLLAQTGYFSHEEFLNIAKCAIDENDFKNSEEFETMSQSERVAKIKEIREKYSLTESIKFDDILAKDFYYFPQDQIYGDYGNVKDDDVTLSVSFVITDENNNFNRLVYLTYMDLYGYKLLYGTTVYFQDNEYLTKDIACVRVSQDVKETKDEHDLDGMWIAFNSSDLMNLNTSDENELMSKVLFTFTLNYDNPSRNSFIINNNFIKISPEYKKVITPVKGYKCQSAVSDDWLVNPSIHNGSKMKITSILRLKDSKNFGCLSRGLYYSKSFSEKFINDSKNAKVSKALKEHLSNIDTRNTNFNAYVEFDYYDAKDSVMKKGVASSLNGDLSSSFSDLFSNLTGVNYEETNSVHLRSISGLKTIINEQNEASFDVLPKSIKIYPKDFKSKNIVTDYLDRWNSDEDGVGGLSANQRDVLTYNDTIEIIVTVINTFIDAITIALVAFSSLSLVVSCFMIAVITYISVVERIKEIGVIRSLGGRKGDVANLFIMETLFTGLFSGLFGIAMTYLFQVIFNAALTNAFGIAIANLTPITAIVMILVSIVLSVVSGLIPSQSAAHKDPVVALRSND